MLKPVGLAKHFDTEYLFTDVSFTVGAGDRVGLVGPNGVGKTTLLSILAGDLPATHGRVELGPDTTLGVLTQRSPDDPQRTTVDAYLRHGLGEVGELTARMRRLETRLAAGEKGALDEYGRVQERWSALQGWTAPNRLAEVRSRLDLAHLADDATLAELSGGEQARLTLARVLLADPDVLLLDEPTNHLDADGAGWLGRWLATFPGGVLVASHDRAFLDRTVNRVIELDGIHPEPQFYEAPALVATPPTGRRRHAAGNGCCWTTRHRRTAPALGGRHRPDQGAGPGRGGHHPQRTGRGQATPVRQEGGQEGQGPRAAAAPPARIGAVVGTATDPATAGAGVPGPWRGRRHCGAGRLRRGQAGRPAAARRHFSGCTRRRARPGHRAQRRGEDDPCCGSSRRSWSRMRARSRRRAEWRCCRRSTMTWPLARRCWTSSAPGCRSMWTMPRSCFGRTCSMTTSGMLHLRQSGAGETPAATLAVMVNSSAGVLLLDEPTNYLDFDALDVVEEARGRTVAPWSR